MTLNIKEIGKNLFYSPTSADKMSLVRLLHFCSKSLSITNRTTVKTLALARPIMNFWENYVNINFFDFPFLWPWKNNNSGAGLTV